MVKTRRPLGSLASFCNVGGEERLRTRACPELTAVERHTRTTYAQREEAWRPLNRRRVAAFIRLFVMCFVDVENGHQLQPVTYKLLRKTLVKRIIPFIYNRLTFTMDEAFWLITLEQFRELDRYLADHLPRLQKDDQWGTVAYFFKEMRKRRDELKRLEDMEKEVFAAVERCLRS